MRALALALLLTACAAKKPHPLMARASFDMSCPQSDLRYTRLGARTQGVTGCGRKATYVKTCSGSGFNEKCTWILNGAVQDDPATP